MRLPLTALTRYERIGVIAANAINTEFRLPTQGGNLPMDRFIESLRLTVRFRLTNAVAAITAEHADMPFSIIERVEVSGFHRIRMQNEVFINVRGSDLAELNRLYNGPQRVNGANIDGASKIYPGAIRALDHRLTWAINAVNDIEFNLDVPFVPLGMPLWKQAEYLLDAPNYDNLTLRIFWADALQLVVAAGATLTLSAFGAVGGNPAITVSGRFAQAGPSLFRGFVPGRIWRTFQEVIAAPMLAVANQQRIFNLPRGNRIRSMLLKVGQKVAVTAGNNVYGALGWPGGLFALAGPPDSGVPVEQFALTPGNVTVFRGTNKVNRVYDSFLDLGEETVRAYGVRPRSGYGLIDYCEHGIEDEIFDLRALIAGPTGDVDCFIQWDIPAAVALSAAVVVYEEWRGGPRNLNPVQRS